MRTTRHLGVRLGSVLLFGLFLLSCSSVDQKPRLTVRTDTIGLGSMDPGEVRSVSIPITNTGSSVLKISDIRTSCGCTTVGNPSMTLAPGQTDTLEVSFNSRGFSGKTTKQVTLTSNDQANKETVVTLVAEIIEELKLISHPGGIVNLGRLERGKTHSEKITVRNMTELPLRVVHATSHGKEYTVSLKPASLEPGETLDLLLRITPGTPGIRQHTISLGTDSKKQPRASIKVVYSS